MDAIFQSKVPHVTVMLAIRYNVNTEQDALAAVTQALEGIGWLRQDHEFFPIMPASPLPDGSAEYTFFKPGSGLFRGWTPEERRTFMLPVRRLLRRLGWTGRIPVQRLTMADCI